MLERLLDIINSPDFEEYGGFLRLDSAEWHDDGVELKFTVSCEERTQRWRVSCEGVTLHRLVREAVEGFELTHNHPLLWPNTRLQRMLFFRGRSGSADRVIEGLAKIHVRLLSRWFPFGYFFNPNLLLEKLLQTGHGLLADGPDLVINAYEEVLQAHNLQTSGPPPRIPVLWNGSAWIECVPELAALVLGESFVVASRFDEFRIE
jgi:hypothetical protein